MRRLAKLWRRSYGRELRPHAGASFLKPALAPVAVVVLAPRLTARRGEEELAVRRTARSQMQLLEVAAQRIEQLDRPRRAAVLLAGDDPSCSAPSSTGSGLHGAVSPPSDGALLRQPGDAAGSAARDGSRSGSAERPAPEHLRAKPRPRAC